MISAGVKTYLSGAHSGALLISGSWGSGKSFFVKHQLAKEIKTIPFRARPNEVLSPSQKVVDIVQKFSEYGGDNYYPIIVSVFGVTSIKDIEKKISDKWFETLSNGSIDRLREFITGTTRFFDRFKKVKEWFDFSGLFELRVSIGTLPKNTVIIFDDLERFTDKIEEKELLGFINELSENRGLKVILVANEQYLNDPQGKLLTYKEKVVEKTLLFEPATLDVARSMINAFNDDVFQQFFERDVIKESVDSNSRFAVRNKNYRAALQNLRTLKFAVNHFYPVFKDILRYVQENNLAAEQFSEIVEYCWFSILAISIELKR